MPCLCMTLQGIFLILIYYWYNKIMDIDYNEKDWATPCPKYGCRKTACKCGLEYVNIPASLGDDSEGSKVAPKNGAYCNALVVYEDNGHVYIYSKEGVPTLIDVDASDISVLEQEVIKAQKDVHELREDIDDFIYGFDTVAQMKAATNLSNGDRVKTLGYYTKNDGGGAFYKVTNTQPSGYYETLSGLLCAELIIVDEVHTKQFGCYGDNIHDDTAALQGAIDYATSKSIGVVHIDNGAYKISSTLVINKTIKIIGEFWMGTTNDNLVYGAQIKQTSANSSIFEFIGRNYRSEISGLSLVANNETGVSAIKTNEVFDEFMIDRVSCSGFDKCFDFAHAGIGVISNCIFSYSNIGIDGQRLYTVNIVYNNFWNNDLAIKIGHFTGCQINGNWIEVDDDHQDGIGLLFQAPSIVQWTEFFNNNYMMRTTVAKFDGTTNITDVMNFNMLQFSNEKMSASTPIIFDMKNADDARNTNPGNLFRIIMTNCVFNNATSGQAIDIDYDALGLNDGMKVINCKAYSSWSGIFTNMFTPGQSNTAISNSYDYGFTTNGNIKINPIANNAIRQNNSIYSDSSHRVWLRNNDGVDNKILIGQKGSTSDRPSSLNIVGDIYFDTTLNKPIWWTGSNWIDATGAVV